MARKEHLTPADFQPAPKPKCARCDKDAGTCIMVNKQKVPICFDCAQADRTAKAKEYCASLGLHTAADCKAWLAKNQLLVKRAPIIQREPGCDDE